MAGFGKITLVGEYYGNRVVNVLWYRSEQWLPLLGNPFTDMQQVVAGIMDGVQTVFLACMLSNYTLLRAEGVGYDDALNIVTYAPVTQTINLPGTHGTNEDSSGAVITAPINMVCGMQHQITGTGTNKRNRGYLAIGPLAEGDVDNYGHINQEFLNNAITDLAGQLDETVYIVGLLSSFVPIRLHKTRVLGLNAGIAYSDVIGYTLPRRFGRRWSRMTEA